MRVGGDGDSRDNVVVVPAPEVLVLELCTAVDAVIEETGYFIVEHPVVDKIVTQRITHGMVVLKLYRSGTKPILCRDSGGYVL